MMRKMQKKTNFRMKPAIKDKNFEKQVCFKYINNRAQKSVYSFKHFIRRNAKNEQRRLYAKANMLQPFVFNTSGYENCYGCDRAGFPYKDGLVAMLQARGIS